MRYKLNIELESSVGFIDPIFFDSLLTSLWIKDNFGFVPTPLNLSEEDVIELPEGLLEEENGLYLASYLMFDKQEDIEYTSYFTKHFHFKDVHLAKFKGKRKVLTNKGDYKSYQLPILLHTIKNCWFVFESEKIDEVKGILERRLYAIGKKRSRGWGRVKSWEIEETDEKIKRFAPVDIEKADPSKPIIYLRAKPPYWSMENAVPCAEVEL